METRIKKIEKNSGEITYVPQYWDPRTWIFNVLFFIFICAEFCKSGRWCRIPTWKPIILKKLKIDDLTWGYVLNTDDDIIEYKTLEEAEVVVTKYKEHLRLLEDKRELEITRQKMQKIKKVTYLKY